MHDEQPSGRRTMDVCSSIRLRLLPPTKSKPVTSLKVKFEYSRFKSGRRITDPLQLPALAPALTLQTEPEQQHEAASTPPNPVQPPLASPADDVAGIRQLSIYSSAGKQREMHPTMQPCRAQQLTAERAAELSGMPLAME